MTQKLILPLYHARNVQSTEIRAIQGEYWKQSNDVNETLEMK